MKPIQKPIGRKHVISVVARHEPTKKGCEFLNNARSSIEKAGFGFRFELKPENSNIVTRLRQAAVRSDRQFRLRQRRPREQTGDRKEERKEYVSCLDRPLHDPFMTPS